MCRKYSMTMTEWEIVVVDQMSHRVRWSSGKMQQLQQFKAEKIESKQKLAYITLLLKNIQLIKFVSTF